MRYYYWHPQGEQWVQTSLWLYMILMSSSDHKPHRYEGWMFAKLEA